MYKAPKRICLAADHKTVVDCDSAEATFQIATEGQEISDTDAKLYGLHSSASSKADKAEADADEAEAPSPQKKAVKGAPENKSLSMDSSGSGTGTNNSNVMTEASSGVTK